MIHKETMTKRLNIVLPLDTVRSIDRLAKVGERSRFIDRAVNHFLATQTQEALRKRLEFTALRDRDLDAEVAADWRAVDEQTWEKPDQSSAFKVTSRGAKSTSRRSIPR